MMKDIDADYYGYMDDDDGILIPLELKAEKECKNHVLHKSFHLKHLILAKNICHEF